MLDDRKLMTIGPASSQRIALITVASMILMGLSPSASFADDPRIGLAIPEFSLANEQGRTTSFRSLASGRTVVVAFLGTECPLAQMYAVRLSEIAREYVERDVAVIGIDSNVQDTLEEIQAFRSTYKVSFQVLKDATGEAARIFGAVRTPETYVLGTDARVQYVGRVDDQFGVGYRKTQASRHDLCEALDDVLAGRTVRVPMTTAAGCFIGRAPQPTAQPTVSYAHDVAPLIQQKCQHCHRVGNIAPFPLMTYEDVSSWGPTIREVVENRRMPPWYADTGYAEFSNDCRLSTQEQETLFRWVDEGMPPGDLASAPPAPPDVSAEQVGWQVAPDVVIPMNSQPFSIPASGVLDYQYFRVNLDITEPLWVRGFETLPQATRCVHHASMIVLERTTDLKTFPNGLKPVELFAAWSPGTPRFEFPEHMAKLLLPGQTILFEMHYTPDGREQLDMTRLGLTKADPSKITHRVTSIPIMRQDFTIPANRAGYRLDAAVTLDRDYIVLAYSPHMHLRGVRYQFDALLPDGEVRSLLRGSYNFNWQFSYLLKDPFSLPKNTAVRFTAVYDNSAGNINVPDPDRVVSYGLGTGDEMLNGWLTIAAPVVPTR